MMVYFMISFTLMLVMAVWIGILGKKFRYRNAEGAEVPFNILDLQFPSSEKEMCNILLGLSPAAKKAVRMQLWVDFLFMAGFYPSIAFLCIMVGEKTDIGQYFFWLIAAFQLFAWLFDILENGYCLRKLQQPVVAATKNGFQTYSFFVYSKFILCLLGLAASLPVIFYFLITGNFLMETFWMAGILLVEVVIASRIKAAR